MNGADNIARARSAIGHGITYQQGDTPPLPSDPLPSRKGEGGTADCSDFVCWVMRLRKNVNATKKWLGTANMHADATGKQLAFRRIARPVPGCVGVYPGHTCVVVDPVKRTIIDMSLSHNGITEHGGGYFWTNPRTVWCVPRAQQEPALPWPVIVPALLLLGTGVYAFIRTRAGA